MMSRDFHMFSNDVFVHYVIFSSKTDLSAPPMGPAPRAGGWARDLSLVLWLS